MNIFEVLQDRILDKAEAGDSSAMIAAAIIIAGNTIGREIDRAFGLSRFAPTGAPGPSEMTVMDRRDQHQELVDILREFLKAFKDQKNEDQQ